MDEIRKLFVQTRQWRQHYRRNIQHPGNSIEAAACAIRERALLDAMQALGMPEHEVKQLEKI